MMILIHASFVTVFAISGSRGTNAVWYASLCGNQKLAQVSKQEAGFP
jgi:hypothetical protein